jgi:hypothetical protein
LITLLNQFVIKAVSDQKDISIFYKTVLALSICNLLVQFLYLPIAFQNGPKWLLALDKPRAEALDSKIE